MTFWADLDFLAFLLLDPLVLLVLLLNSFFHHFSKGFDNRGLCGLWNLVQHIYKLLCLDLALAHLGLFLIFHSIDLVFIALSFRPTLLLGLNLHEHDLAHGPQFLEFLFLDFRALSESCKAVVGGCRILCVVKRLSTCLAVLEHSLAVLLPVVLDEGLHCAKLSSAVIVTAWCIAEVFAEGCTGFGKMLLMVCVREDTAALIALKVDLVEIFLHFWSQLLLLPRQTALTALPRASALAKLPLAAPLAESFLALTAADRLPDHVIADLALEELRIEVLDGLPAIKHPVRILDHTWVHNRTQLFDEPLQQLPIDMLCHGVRLRQHTVQEHAHHFIAELLKLKIFTVSTPCDIL